MAADGIHVLEDLACLPQGVKRAKYARLLGVLERELGGEVRHTPLARERPAFREHDPVGLRVGSISNERTFFDAIGGDAPALRELLRLVERVCWRARKRGIKARTITLKLRYSDFHTITRSRGVEPTAEEAAVLRTVTELFQGHRQPHRAIRLLGVALSHLVEPDDAEQLVLPFVRTAPVGRVMDQVRMKYGYDSVHLGGSVAGPHR
jgi:DNA polymerase-4